MSSLLVFGSFRRDFMPPGPVNRKLQTLSSWRHFETKQTADFTKQTRINEDEKIVSCLEEGASDHSLEETGNITMQTS